MGYRECDYCGGSGKLEVVEQEPLMYGKHKVGHDWEKIDHVWIWFEAFHKGTRWNGIPGYVFQKPDGTYIAPFRGQLISVVKDTKDEFREYKEIYEV